MLSANSRTLVAACLAGYPSAPCAILFQMLLLNTKTARVVFAAHLFNIKHVISASCSSALDGSLGIPRLVVIF